MINHLQRANREQKLEIESLNKFIEANKPKVDALEEKIIDFEFQIKLNRQIIQDRDQKLESMDSEHSAFAQKVKKLEGLNSASMDLIHDFEKQN